MDRITQLQDGIDQLQQLMLASIDFLHTRAPLLATSSDVPVTKRNATKKELAVGLCRLVKQNEIIIDSLPDLSCTEESQLNDISTANEATEKDLGDLEVAIKKAEELKELISETLLIIQHDQLSTLHV